MFNTLLLILISLFFTSCIRYPIARIDTSQGKIYIQLSDETPAHKANFIAMAKSGYWDSLTFNRVIPNFVAQAGCPDMPEGFTDTAMLMPHEIKLKHIYGAVCMGRDDNPQMNSARCQFYIVQNKKGLPKLDGKYTIFGQVLKGMPVEDEIVHVKRDTIDQPLQPVTIKVDIFKMSSRKIKSLKD